VGEEGVGTDADQLGLLVRKIVEQALEALDLRRTDVSEVHGIPVEDIPFTPEVGAADDLLLAAHMGRGTPLGCLLSDQNHAHLSLLEPGLSGKLKLPSDLIVSLKQPMANRWDKAPFSGMVSGRGCPAFPAVQRRERTRDDF